MNFKIKTLKVILNDMALWVKTNCSTITNFLVGSVIRTLLEAVAVEIESLYFQMYRMFKNAIEGAIYTSFSFSKIAAIPSTGDVTINFSSVPEQGFTIPKGHRFSTLPVQSSSIFFESTSTVEVPQSNVPISVLVPVSCVTPGIIGNIPAYSIQIAVSPLPYVTSIYNQQPFTNGKPEETSEALKKRFTDYIESLSKGIISAIQYGCINTPGVSGAYVHESDSLGIVYAYIHDSQGNLSNELINAVKTNLINYRSAGIEVEVLPVVKRTVDLDIQVQLSSTGQYTAAEYEPFIMTSTQSYLNSYGVSQNLYRAGIIKYIMMINEEAIVNVQLDLSGDIIVQENELIRPGIIQVTATV